MTTGAVDLAGPPLPIYPKNAGPVECPDCRAVDWVWRPDGSRLCGHCLDHRSVMRPNSNGDFTWCRICVVSYWQDRDRALALLKSTRREVS